MALEPHGVQHDSENFIYVICGEIPYLSGG